MDSPLFSSEDRAAAVALGELGFTNPFTRRRTELEQQALAAAYIDAFPVWVVDPQTQGANPNVAALSGRAEHLAAHARERASKGGLKPSDRRVYEELVLYLLYTRYEGEVKRMIGAPGDTAAAFFGRFRDDVGHFLAGTGLEQRPANEPARLLALLFQLRRAFHFTFRGILGTSTVSTQLRVQVWQSIFTHDLRRYRESLYRRMHEVSTLVLGASGTGKELVASAIASSRWIPLAAGGARFEADFAQCFVPVHLAALPATTIESELFGHRKGAFTGAVADRTGYLETPHEWDTVFLDEIGDLPPDVQVKLLRVLQTRRFQRLGDTRPRQFHGRIVSATNRDLVADMNAGRFRADLYYRLCSDIVRTPTLREQIAGDPDELGRLVELISDRIVDGDAAATVAGEAREWIGRNLRGYDWPGNMRELEQCVRSVLVRGEYRPASSAAPAAGAQGLADDVRLVRLSHDELLARYFAMAYALEGSYEGAARRIGVDRRTLKARLDRAFLERLGTAGRGTQVL